MQTVLQEAANGKRIPEWVLPDSESDVDPALLNKMRPDILRIKGLRTNSAQTEIHTKAGQTIQIIEVGPDTRWRKPLQRSPGGSRLGGGRALSHPRQSRHLLHPQS
jgi:hypothetical protein